MSSVCHHLAPNGQKSILYQQLELKVGADKAHDIWTDIRSQQFLNKHGDWTNTTGSVESGSSYTNHSGGANGADTWWEKIGKEYGVDQHNQYWHGTKTPTGNFEISNEEIEEGWQQVLKANLSLKRRPNAAKHKSLLGRNWFQVKNSDGVFAIGKLASPATVDGGTGWAVQMAIDNNKPVYVFDQETMDWYEYSYKLNRFIRTTTPKLTKNFAGIGSRKLTEAGKAAIRTVYAKTFTASTAEISLDMNGEPTIDWVLERVNVQSVPVEREVVKRSFEPAKAVKVSERQTEEEFLATIKNFYDEASKNPEKIYTVDYLAKSEKKRYPSGYTSKELAILFDSIPMPSNVAFTESFGKLIANTPRRILSSFTSIIPVELMGRDEAAIHQDMARLLVPRIDADGNHVGFFDSAEHLEVVNSMLYTTVKYLTSDPSLKGNAIIKAFYSANESRKAMDAAGIQNDRRENLFHIYQAREQFADALITKLETLGWKISDQARARILSGVRYLQNLGEREKQVMDEKELEFADTLDDTEDFEEAMGHGLKDWNDVVFELDPKDTASARLKLFMAVLPEMDRGVFTVSEEGVKIMDADIIQAAKTGPAALKALKEKDPARMSGLMRSVHRRQMWLGSQEASENMQKFLQEEYPRIPMTNFIGLRKLVDFEEIFKDTMELLADQPQDIGKYIETLAGSGKPNLQNLALELERAPEQLQNEFAKVMKKQYQQFTLLLFKNTKEDGMEFFELNPINANRYSQKNTILKHWKENQKLSPIMIPAPGGDRQIDTERAIKKWVPYLERARSIDKWVTETVDKNTRRKKKWLTEEAKREVATFGNILRYVGIDMSDEMLKDLFLNTERWTKGSKYEGGIARQFMVTKDGQPNGIFSSIIMKLAGFSSDADQEEDVEPAKRAELNNPLYTENSAMKVLSAVAAKYTPALHSPNHKSGEGKSVWDYGLPTRLSNTVLAMKTDFEGFKAQFKDIDIARDNWMLTLLSDNPKMQSKIQVEYMDVIKPSWAKKGTTRQGMSDREQALFAIGNFQNKGQSPKYVSLTHADKTTTPVFSGFGKAVNIGKVIDDRGAHLPLPSTVVGDMTSKFFQVFKAEHSRILNQKKPTNNRQYDQGKQLFYFIPDFNYDAMKAMVETGELTEKEFTYIWVGGQRNLTQVIHDDRELPVINKIINRYLDRIILNTEERWMKYGIIGKKNLQFDRKYIRKMLKAAGIKASKSPSGKYTYTNDKGLILSEEQLRTIMIKTATRDFAVNYTLFNISTSQIMFGDPAMAYKGKDGMNDLEKVAATMKEYSKRLAKDIAPGQEGNWLPNERKFTAITLADVETSENYLENTAPELAKAYGKVDATDAQEFTTVKEHLRILKAMGLVPATVFNEMVKIIDEAGPEGYYAFEKPEHLEVVMQPMKPVYSYTRKVGRAMMEDYVKSSSYPLYPPMIRGTELWHLRTMMEFEGIDRAHFASAKKLGQPTEPVTVFNKKGEFTLPSTEVLKAGIVQLDRAGFRIQQEVPYEETKTHIKTVSQMNKLITQGIGKISGFQVPGHDKMNGTELRKLKEEVRSKMIGLQLREFLSKLNIDEDTLDFNDKGKIYELLVEEATRKGYTLNELQSLIGRDENGELHIPLVYNTGVDRFESLLMSMVKKIVDVKMTGKSFIQASSVGYSFKDEASINKSKIVWLDGYDGSPLKTLHHDKDGKVRAAQVLVPFNFMDASGNAVDISKYTIRRDGRTYIDETKIPRELMQLIGARIPNQGHNSMLPIEIVGFVPAEMGDIIVVPSAITKQMGADFDVDKLFTYRRPYVIQEDGSFTMVPLESEDQMAKLQGQYFDIHWAVLMHPKMTQKILSPLDKKDLKLEAEKHDPKTLVDFYDVNSQMDDFQRGKDAKLLVGATSLSVTFNSVIEDKALHIVKQVLVDSDEVEGEKKVKIVRDHVYVLGDNGEEIGLTNLSGEGKSSYNGEERTKHDNHTTIQSAAVDNAKERTLDNLNITRHTYRAAAAFVQLEDESGTAVDLRYVVGLLTQPVIREYDELMRQGNDSLSEEFSRDLHGKVVAQLLSKLISEGKLTEEQIEEIDTIRFSPKKFDQARSMDGAAFVMHQLAALQLFSKLTDIGQRMGEIKSMINQDTNGAGKNILASLDKQKKIDEISTGIIAGAEDLLDGTEQETIYNATTVIANVVLTQVLPYHKLQPVFDRILAESGRDKLSNDQQRSIVKAVRSFVYSQGQHWWINAQEDRVRLMYNRADEPSLARRLMEVKRTWGKDNYFLARLDVRIGDSKEGPDYVEYQAASIGRIDEQQNVRAWMEMLLSSDPLVRSLGEDLLRYAFLTGGVQDANSFVKFVPVSYIANTGFGQMLKDRNWAQVGSEVNGSETPGFIEQFFQHNPDMATQLSTDVFKGESVEYLEAIPVPEIDNPKFSAFSNLLRGKELLPYASFRSKTEGKMILYKLHYQGAQPYYIRIDTLGNQYSDEYNGNIDSGQRSLFTDNRSLAQVIPAANAIQQIEDAIRQEGGSANETVYEKLGVSPGGLRNIEAATSQIASNVWVPQYLRTTATMLSGTKGLNREAAAVLGIHFIPSLVFDETLATAGTSKSSGSIVINPLMASSVKGGAEVFLHELMHNRLQTVIMATGNDPRVIAQLQEAGPDALQAYLNNVAKFKGKYTKLQEHIDELERVRYEALNRLRKDLGEERFNEVVSEVTNGTTGSHEHMLVYALSSVHELTSHVMTNSHVAAYLNKIESSKGQSILSLIMDKIAELFLEMANAFGFPVRDKSLLKDALIHTIALVQSEGDVQVTVDEALSKQTLIITDTEGKANEIRDLAENVYHRVTNTELRGHEHVIHITNEIRGKSQVDKLTEALGKQLEDAGYAMGTARSRKERIAAAIRYRDIKEQLQELKRTKSVNLIAVTGKKQMEWVDKVLAKDKPTAVEVNMAIKLSNMWGGIIELLYSEFDQTPEVSDDLAKIAAAGKRRVIDLTAKAKEVVAEALSGRITLKASDFKEIEEKDTITANVMSLSRTRNLLVQSIATLGRDAAGNRDEEMFRVRKRLEALEQKMKKHGIKPEDLMQEEGWGLMGRLSSKWNEHITGLKDKLHSSLDAIDRAQYAPNKAENEKIINQRKAQTWEAYWKEIRRTAVFVDTRLFFNFDTGELLTDTEEHFKALATAVGSESYAQELVDDAQDRFKDYLQYRTDAEEHIKEVTELSDEEKAGKTPEEVKQLLAEKVSKEVDKWRAYNSPTEFLRKMTGKEADMRYLNYGDRWVIMAPRAKFQEFYDKNFTRLDKNKALESVLEEYRSIMQELIPYLPVHERQDLDDNFLPIVSPDTVNSMAGMLDKIRNFDKTVMEAMTATEEEEYARLHPDKVPVLYTKASGRTKELENRSTDLIRVAEAFANMALHYKYMAPVVEAINVAETIIKEENAERIAGRSEGKVLRNTMDTIKYFKDALIYKKPKELQGKIDTPIYSINPAKSRKMENRARELEKRRIEIKDEINRQMIDEGNFETPELDKELEEIDKELTSIADQARFIYGSKLADNLITINQLKALSYNPFSAVTNFTFGMMSIWLHANGRRDFDKSTLGKAQLLMRSAQARYFTFGASTDKTAQKVSALMERLGVMGDIVDSAYGASQLHTRQKGVVRKAVSPYNWQKSGDYYNKGSMMVAMLMYYKVQATDKNGVVREISLWEALDENGNWDTTQYQANQEWYSDDVNEQVKWNHFRSRVRKVGMLVFGNQDKNSPLMAKKHFLTRLIGQFRLSWFPEGVAARFMTERMDTELGRVVKGRYRTYGSLGFSSLAVLFKQLLSTLPGLRVDPFNGVTDRKGNPISEADIENMRKNFAEIGLAALLFAAFLLVKSLADGDDDKKRKKKKGTEAMSMMLLANMLTRNYNDLMLYAQPGVFDTVTGNLVPATAVVTDTWKALKASAHYMVSEGEQEDFDKWLTKFTRAIPVVNLYPKTRTMLTRDLNTIER
jgi:hypothetical protein